MGIEVLDQRQSHRARTQQTLRENLYSSGDLEFGLQLEANPGVLGSNPPSRIQRWVAEEGMQTKRTTSMVRQFSWSFWCCANMACMAGLIFGQAVTNGWSPSTAPTFLILVVCHEIISTFTSFIISTRTTSVRMSSTARSQDSFALSFQTAGMYTVMSVTAGSGLPLMVWWYRSTCLLSAWIFLVSRMCMIFGSRFSNAIFSGAVGETSVLKSGSSCRGGAPVRYFSHVKPVCEAVVLVVADYSWLESWMRLLLALRTDPWLTEIVCGVG